MQIKTQPFKNNTLASWLTYYFYNVFLRVVNTVDNIKMDLQEGEWVGMDRIDLSQDRDRWQALVNAEMSLRVP